MILFPTVAHCVGGMIDFDDLGGRSVAPTAPSTSGKGDTMRSRILGHRIAVLVVAIVVLAAAGCSDSDDESTGGTEDLFVVNAASGSLEGSTLTLRGVPSVVYFTDRPERDAGHLAIDDYVALWTPPADEDDFAPPNADLSVFDPAGDINAVVVLQSVSSDADEMVFDIQLLEGELPGATFGPAVLFVDACDPASPWCRPY